jgi:hypothetical protein
MSHFSIRSIPLNDIIHIFSDDIGCFDDRKDDELDVLLVGMAFEHMDTCLESSLEGRNKYDFEVNLISND